MYEQFSQQFINFSRNAADSALKAQQIAADAFAKTVSLQIGLAEERAKANGEFAKTASDVRDADTAKQVWPMGSDLVRENLEKFYGVSKEIMELNLKTAEQLGDLFQTSFETAKAETEKAQTKATKAAKSAAK